MICFLTHDFNFNIFSRFSNKVIFTKSLVKNKKSEVIKCSKINFISNDIDLLLAPTKSYFFTVYVEYDIYFLQFTFEIWFSDIESNRYQFLNELERIEYFNSMNLGDKVSITNFRVYNLNGRLIDMVAYDRKIWVDFNLIRSSQRTSQTTPSATTSGSSLSCTQGNSRT